MIFFPVAFGGKGRQNDLRLANSIQRGPDLTPKNIGPAKRFTPHNKSQKFLNSRVSTKNQTEELCVIRTTLEYLRKQNRQIRLDERYSDGIRLLIVLCNDYIPVPNFCIFKIKRLMIERT